MAAAVHVALGSASTGEKFALFTPKAGSGSFYRRILGPYGARHGSGYLVPLDASLRACVALQSRGVELHAKKPIPETVKFAAWTCKLLNLYPYQRSGAEFLHSRRRALLADQMGTGKTVAALAAMDAKRATVVIVPSVVVGNWYKEARRWRPDLRALIWKKPYPIFPDAGELHIVPYSQLPHDLVERRSRCPYCNRVSVVPLDDEEVFVLQQNGKPWTDKCDPDRGGMCRDVEGNIKRRRFMQRKEAWPEWVWVGDKPKTPVTLVADEAHYLKTKDSQRTTAVRTIATQCSRVWLLTGTPLLNQPPELWSLCQIFPGRGGNFDDGAWDTFGSWKNFLEMFGGRKNYVNGVHRGYEFKPGFATPEARECLGSVMLRRMRVDVLPQLPRKTRRAIDVEIDHRALSKHVKLTDNQLLQFRNWNDEQVLAECAAGGALSTIRKELAALKLDALVDFIKEYEQQEEPVVAFSYHRDPIDALSQREGWAKISGDTSDGERTAIVERFQKGELLGLAGTIGAMGVGVTLTRAANVMFLDRDFVPANNLQAEDRLLRITQERGVLVTVLNAIHPVDQRVAIILERKEKLLEAMQLHEERTEGAP